MNKEIKLTKTQSRVFNFMVENGSITTKQAIDEFGETRLSARIFELKKQGVLIDYNWKKVKNRFNEDRRVKEYYIV